MRILIIEDEKSLAAFLQKGLQQEGYEVTITNEGSQGLQKLAQEDYQLVLLDLMLPGQNGFDIMANMRRFKLQVPVIILSAVTDTTSVVEGLDKGAYDYLRKPFEFDELLARIRAITRIQQSAEPKILIEDLSIDLLSKNAERRGAPIALTRREFLILEVLAQNANRIVTKAQLLERVWGVMHDMSSNIVEVHIYQLRKKIDQDYDKKLIQTQIGNGYMLKGEVAK